MDDFQFEGPFTIQLQHKQTNKQHLPNYFYRVDNVYHENRICIHGLRLENFARQETIPNKHEKCGKNG